MITANETTDAMTNNSNMYRKRRAIYAFIASLPLAVLPGPPDVAWGNADSTTCRFERPKCRVAPTFREFAGSSNAPAIPAPRQPGLEMPPPGPVGVGPQAVPPPATGVSDVLWPVWARRSAGCHPQAPLATHSRRQGPGCRPPIVRVGGVTSTMIQLFALSRPCPARANGEPPATGHPPCWQGAPRTWPI